MNISCSLTKDKCLEYSQRNKEAKLKTIRTRNTTFEKVPFETPYPNFCILQNKFEVYNLLNISSYESIHMHVINNDKT